jgi:ketosteroid isomerase-like protein
MSRENLEAAERGYAALQRDDLESFLAYVHPEAEWHSLVLEVEGVRYGHDGVRDWWAGLRAVFPDWSPEIIEVRDLGDWVVIHAQAKGSAERSGVGINADFWQAALMREGLIVWYGAFRTEAEALEAVRLSE